MARSSPLDSARRRFLHSGVALALALPTVTAADILADPGLVAAAAIRTITAGLNLTPDMFAGQLLRARKSLETARSMLQASGFVVQTLRITTQPQVQLFAGLSVTDSKAMIDAMKALLGDEISLSIGPGNAAGDQERAMALCHHAALAGVTSSLSTGDVATGVDFAAIRSAATLIKTLAAEDPFANFQFGALSNVGPGVPFFPAGYHGGAQPTFAVGTEGASIFKAVCADIADLSKIQVPLEQAYGKFLLAVEAAARAAETVGDWHYAGVDTTPAQWGDVSMGAAVESLIQAPFGSPGTLAACQIFTRVIKSVPVQRTGYQGLFLPPLEDKVMAARAYDHYGLSALLSYSAVCGTGLDAVAIPGDTTRPELERILLDVASMAIRLNKPLTARLFPVPGKRAGQSTGPLGNLFPMKILAVR